MNFSKDEGDSHPPRGDYSDVWQHHDIGVLIRATQDFVVHIDKNGHIDWETTREYDRSVKTTTGYSITKYSAILNDCAVLETLPCPGFSSETIIQFKRLLGEAIVNLFELDYVSAQRMVAMAGQFHKNRSMEISRKWYLVASFKAVFPALFVSGHPMAMAWIMDGDRWRSCILAVTFRLRWSHRCSVFCYYS